MSQPGSPEVTKAASGGFRVEIAPHVVVADVEREGERIADPASAVETIHWGRNYLYSVLLETAEGPLPAVVKQFRNQGWRRRLERRLKGSKAERSWRTALAMRRAGLPTPQPLMLLESLRPDGPSLFVTRQLADVTEARYLFRALRAGTVGEQFPHLDLERFVDDLGAMIRRLHEAGVWHRDLSIGNVLLERARTEASPPLSVIDLNRARLRARISVSQRTRDLCRLGFPDPVMGKRLLLAYWGESARGMRFKWALYRGYRWAYLLRVEGKKGVRDRMRSLGAALFTRKPHAHIPAAPEGAGVRDKAVWDKLSDQPHQHASRSERARVRAADVGVHARAIGGAVAAWPRIRRRYRGLVSQLWKKPVAWPGVGIAVGPESAETEELLAALEESGASQVLMRLHPWEDDWTVSEDLARELSSRGYELTFALPQVRQLVRQPQRWTEAVAEIGRRFIGYGNRFQIGQAINRSKWGVWNVREYAELAAAAAECLRDVGPVELLGPAVIDFEPHAMAAALNFAGCPRFEIASSLLYVDRRGAPENRQLGYDTLGKAALMRAIAATATHETDRLWVTEVNWPLWEGPHSPAGKTVSVDEERQADYLVRYYVPVLASGLAERVFWWQLVARGYGLVDPREGGLRRRPSFAALSTLAEQLRGCVAHGPVAAPENALVHRFSHSDRGEVLVGWTTGGEARLELPGSPERLIARGGDDLESSGDSVRLTPSPVYVRLSST